MTQLHTQAVQVTQQPWWCRCSSCCCCVYVEVSWLCTCVTAAFNTASPHSPTATTTRALARPSSLQEMNLVRAEHTPLSLSLSKHFTVYLPGFFCFHKACSSFTTLLSNLNSSHPSFTLTAIADVLFVLPPKGDDDEDDPMIGGFADDVPMVIA